MRTLLYRHTELKRKETDMRTEGDLIKINDWLLPLSWIYGGMVRFRNWLFDIGLKKSQSFSSRSSLWVTSLVGGSGKTPMWSI